MVEPSDRLRVYVAGPITQGDPPENIHRALRWGRRMVRDGLAPYVPHLDVFMFMGINGSGDVTREMLLDWDYAWVAISEAVFRLAGRSEGADLEVELALSLGIPVYFEVEDEYNELVDYGGVGLPVVPEYTAFRGDSRA